jgi:hypothetical protein
MKLLPLTLLLSATSRVLADRKITYACYDPHSNNTRDVFKTWKSGGSVGDAFAEKIVKHMPEWSDHKYTATLNPWPRGAVSIRCSEKTMGTDKLAEEIVEMEKIVKEKILEEGR